MTINCECIKIVIFLIVITITNIGYSQIIFKDESTRLDYEALDNSGQHIIKKHDFNSIITMGVTDMNNDFHDDIVILNYEGCEKMSLHVLYQLHPVGFGEPQFEHFEYFENIDLMKALTIGDIDEDGKLDVFAGGKHNGLKIYPTTGFGTIVTPTISSHRSLFYLQGCNFIDIDQDGDLDIFAANDDHISEVLYNNSGSFSSDFTHLKPEAYIQSCVSAYPEHQSNAMYFDPNSGNYGSVFADIDFDEVTQTLNPELYISKCKGGTYPSNSQGCTINLLYQKQANGNYQEVGPDWNLDDFNQSWAADFGDINNDGKLDVAIINHDAGNKNIRILKNNGASFIEIFSENISNSYQVIMEDFDNDGYLDIIVTNNSSSLLYINNSDETFTKLSNWIDITVDNNSPYFGKDYKFISCATGDLDEDGYIDLYADYHDSQIQDPLKDVLFLNQGTGNNYIKVVLEGNPPNKFGIGARIHLTDNSANGLGTQVREIRAGESYGIVCSHIQHFGLSGISNLSNYTMKVFWPSGGISTIGGSDIIINDHNYISE